MVQMDCNALGRLAWYSNLYCCYNEYDETFSVPMNEPDDREPPKQVYIPKHKSMKPVRISHAIILRLGLVVAGETNDKKTAS